VSAVDVIRPELRGLVGYRWQDTLPADAPLMRFDMNTSAVAMSAHVLVLDLSRPKL